MSRSEIYSNLGEAMLTGNKERARQIYYKQITPNPEFSHREYYNLSFRVGAIDEGDKALAGNTNL